MTFTLTNLTESILNPYGRFRTLENFSAVCDESGDPCFAVMTHSYNFLVDLGGRRYLLKSFCRPGSRAETSARLLATALPGLGSPYLVGTRYLDREILIFDDKGNPHHGDILLQEMPEGLTLGAFIKQRCASGDTASLHTVCAELCRMGAWLLPADLIHGNLKLSNILVTPALKPLLINYEQMATPATDESFDLQADADNIALATLGAASYILSCNPSLYRALGGHLVFQFPHLHRMLARLILPAGDGHRPLERLLGMLGECRDTIRDRRHLAATLLDLAACGSVPAVGLSAVPTEPTDPQAAASPSAVAVRPDLSAYEWCSAPAETLTCVTRGDRFGFVDGQGAEVIPLVYDWACDFREGRAVVVRDDLYGMIDRTGREIVPAVYELLDWDADNGIAKVMSEGRFGLLNRLGDEIVPLEYEWLGEMESDLILARRDDRYGYLHRDGSTAIPFEFDDAYDFNDGRALVLRDDQNYYIDTKGNALTNV